MSEIELTVWKTHDMRPILNRLVKYISYGSASMQERRTKVLKEARRTAQMHRKFESREEWWIPGVGVIVAFIDGKCHPSLRRVVQWWDDKDYRDGSAIMCGDGGFADGWNTATRKAKAKEGGAR